jgi:hypothetical protein
VRGGPPGDRRNGDDRLGRRRESDSSDGIGPRRDGVGFDSGGGGGGGERRFDTAGGDNRGDDDRRNGDGRSPE